MSDFKNNLKYPISIEGIEVTDSQQWKDCKPQIMITKSLTINQSKYYLILALLTA